MKTQPHTQNYRQLVKLGAGEVTLPKEEHASELCGVKRSALKTYVRVTLYRFNRLYLGIYVHINTHMQAITVDVNRNAESEREWEELTGEF